ncbi:MAG: type II toxin-antitoxin system VapC family toxin [Gammaproteobacteria bacterium]|nr:type II toxin-antitoxin system VapC family toxin [Gammaproteobacteria bacterium]
MRVYFDSSAFAKRYVQEPGTDVVLDWCERADELALAVIAVPELISAFCRLHREGSLDEAEYCELKNDLTADIADALLCDITQEVVSYAVNALENNVLRGMDAIHIGAALACKADTFVSGDQRQCLAAQALGLNVIEAG